MHGKGHIFPERSLAPKDLLEEYRLPFRSWKHRSDQYSGREGGYPTLLGLANLIEFGTITAPKF